MIDLGTFYVQHQREECELFAATANDDTLAKGAIINFIASIGWLDKFQPQVLEKPLHNIFPQKKRRKLSHMGKKSNGIRYETMRR